MRQQLTTGGIAIKAYSRKYDQDCALFNLRGNDTFGGPEVTVANARLLAASPAFLEALRYYAAIKGPIGEPARQAIAKMETTA